MKLSVIFLSSSLLLACSGSADDAASSEGAQTADMTAKTGAAYFMNDGYLTGSLNVKAADASSLTFDLSLVQVHRPHNMGDLSGTAKGGDNHFVYTDDDCKLDLVVKQGTIEAKQEGICGMGFNVAANGTFQEFVGDASKLRSGEYDNLSLSVAGGVVTGMLRDMIGDPAHGGATCELSISGKLGKDERSTDITVTDAYDSYPGKLLVRDEKNVAISVAHLPNACSRMYQEDEFAKPEGYAFKFGGLLDPSVQAFRTVKADKSFFHDTAGGPARKGYVVKGDTVFVTGGSAQWVQVRFVDYLSDVETTGFVAGSDLL
ncbi:MAG TPA: hypothetical protein VIF62_09000 [Labilithrix sp.]